MLLLMNQLFLHHFHQVLQALPTVRPEERLPPVHAKVGTRGEGGEGRGIQKYLVALLIPFLSCVDHLSPIPNPSMVKPEAFLLHAPLPLTYW